MDLYERRNNINNTDINHGITSNKKKRRYNSNVDLLTHGGVNVIKRSKTLSSSSLDASSSSRCNNNNCSNNDIYNNNRTILKKTPTRTSISTLTSTTISLTSANISCRTSDETLPSISHNTINEPPSSSSPSSCTSYYTVDGPSTSKKSFINYNGNISTTRKRKRRLSSCTNSTDPGLDLQPSAKRVPNDSSLSPSTSLQCEKNSTTDSVISPLPPDSPPYYSLEQTVDKEDEEEDGECKISSRLLATSTTHDNTTNGHDNANCKKSVDDDDGGGSDCISDDDDCDIASEWSSYSSQSHTYLEKSSKLLAENYINDNNVAIHYGERTPGGQLLSSSCNGVVQENDECNRDSSHNLGHHDQYHCLTPAIDNEQIRQCPLPALAWANADDVWQLMCHKDELVAALRDPNMMDYHPSLQSRMRAILLDWLIEVCEVYKLHRETFYLAVDYLDRYLSLQRNVQKTHLQLIGITCLFIAAKVEEIYPPKIGEFAYVTDGACCEDDILKHEILLLRALQWNINPITPVGWLGVYMQLKVTNRTPTSFKNKNNSSKSINNNNNNNNNSDNKDIHQNISISQYRHKKFEKLSKSPLKDESTLDLDHKVDKAFIYPQFSSLEFVQTAQLLDLCSLDIDMNRFSYSVLAAAALSHTFSKETAINCSGLDWQRIQPCNEWMQPFFQVVAEQSHTIFLLEQNDNTATKYGLGHICPNIITDDSHVIQTHSVSMAMLDRVCLLQEEILIAKIKQEVSPANGLLCPRGLLTPPDSDRKLLINNIIEEIKVIIEDKDHV